MTVHLDWDWYQQQMDRGRKITTTIDPDLINSPQFFDCWLYYKEQERQVSTRGYCEGGCRPEELRECSGRIVCRRTLEICPRQQLSGLVCFYSGVFDEYNNTSGT